jgi:chromate transporter
VAEPGVDRVAVTESEPAAPRPAPRAPLDLFLAFSEISLQSFGGALAQIERTLVQRRRWLSSAEFVGLFGISQVLPGPTGIAFCVLLGDRHFGLRGAAAALAGFLVLPAALVMGLTALFQAYSEHLTVQGALNGMGAASIGLIVHTASRMARTLRGRWAGVAVAALTFGAVGLLRWPVGGVLLTLGALSVLWHWRGLAAGRLT